MKQVCIISSTCHAQRSLSDSLHKQCVPTFGIEPMLHRRSLQRTNLHGINMWHPHHPHLLSCSHLLLLTLRKHIAVSQNCNARHKLHAACNFSSQLEITEWEKSGETIHEFLEQLEQ